MFWIPPSNLCDITMSLVRMNLFTWMLLHLTREDGVALVKRFNGEFPDKYFDEVVDYVGIDPDYFKECDDFRSPHLWKKSSGEWKLRHNVFGEGIDD
jgi:hypothetical protein